MSRAIHMDLATLFTKIKRITNHKKHLFNDGGNLSVRHSINGLLTWYFTYRPELVGRYHRNV